MTVTVLLRFVCGALAFLTATSADAATLRVAVASNFAPPMREIVASFERETGHVVQMAFGSSGKLYAQITNGAPFDVFLSADQNKPKALEADSLAASGSRFTYAVGALALWTADHDTENAEDRLRSGRFRKLAIANPRLAPYGMAAVEVLQTLGLKESTEERWVFGENIAQTFQFVATGNAELGFVALAQLVQTDMLQSAWIIPASMHGSVRQDAVRLARSREPDAAQELLDFLASGSAQSVIQRFGYRLAPGS